MQASQTRPGSSRWVDRRSSMQQGRCYALRAAARGPAAADSGAAAAAGTERAAAAAPPEQQQGPATCRRALLQAGVAAAAAAVSSSISSARAAEPPPFVTTESGLKVQDVRVGEGATPRIGDRVSVHWSGYTKGYQGKRIDNTSVRDEPYEFVLGSHEAIAAFEEAVASMKVGGIRRVEVPGSRPELGYPLSRAERFTNELISPEGKIFKYRVGPQPIDLGGQRALDFVLDNSTLQDFNRTLLFDIKLLAVRPAPQR